MCNCSRMCYFLKCMMCLNAVLGKIMSKSKTISNQNQNRLSKNDLKSKSKSLFSKRFEIRIMYKMIFKIKIIQTNLLAFLQCSEQCRCQ